MTAPTAANNGAPPKAAAYVVAKLRELDAALVVAAPRVVSHGVEQARNETKWSEGGDAASSPRHVRQTRIDEEAVHDLRVAIRRMRTLLKMSRGLFGRWHTDVVREAFAEVMRATGDLRDEEVLEETLSDAVQGPEFDEWLVGRRAREDKLRRNVVARIERGDLDRARLMLKALLVFPVEPDRNVDLSRFARRTVEGARRKVEGRRDVEVSDITGMHDLRIAYKELRYSIELLADALPIDARAQLEPATVFQKRLGELHDVDVAAEVVREAKGLSAETRAEALSALSAMRNKRVGKYLRELDPLGAPRASIPSSPPTALPPLPVVSEEMGRAETMAIDAVTPRNGAAEPEPAGEAGPPSSIEDAPTVHIKNWDLRRSPQK